MIHLGLNSSLVNQIFTRVSHLGKQLQRCPWVARIDALLGHHVPPPKQSFSMEVLEGSWFGELDHLPVLGIKKGVPEHQLFRL